MKADRIPVWVLIGEGHESNHARRKWLDLVEEDCRNSDVMSIFRGSEGVPNTKVRTAESREL